MAVHHPATEFAGGAWPREATSVRITSPAAPSRDLFERTAPLYAFMRERLFRDDTDGIVRALWPHDEPRPGETLLELGCGPGLYTRRLAARFPSLLAVGVDRADGLLTLARARADADGLTNCHFERGDALALNWPDASVESIVASRLLTVVDAPAAISEIYRTLRPGGRCFLAEPVSALGTLLPFAALRLAGWLAGADTIEAPRQIAGPELAAAIKAHPWVSSSLTTLDGYIYAVCQKPGGPAA